MSLHQIYKPVGKTPLEVVNEFKRDNNVKKVAYCGRLDPMAHGTLLLACDTQVKNMELYNKKDKSYTVKVLVGVSTDSTDRLGLVNTSYFSVGSREFGKIPFSFSLSGRCGDVVVDCVKMYNGITYNQDYHVYSSIPVSSSRGRMPYWRLTKLGGIPDLIPSKQVTIYSVSDVLLGEINVGELKRCIFEDGLYKLTDSGDFNVEGIKESWDTFFNGSVSNVIFPLFETVTFTVKVSSGTYIRQLVKDMSNELGIPLVVLDLFRHEF